MRKYKLIAVAAVAMAVCLLLPSAALAKPKATTKFLGIGRAYQYSAGSSVAIQGRLAYRKTVIKHGKRRTSDAPMKGVIRLYRFDPATGRLAGAGVYSTPSGSFRFNVNKPGRYMVYFGGTHNRKSCRAYASVDEDSLGIDGFGAVRASEIGTSGNIFVEMGADVSGPTEAFSEHSPATLVLLGMGLGPDDSRGFMRLPSAVSPLGLPLGFFTLSAQTISAPGPYRIGFTVPASSAEQTMSIAIGLSSDHYVSKMALAEINAGNLLR